MGKRLDRIKTHISNNNVEYALIGGAALGVLVGVLSSQQRSVQIVDAFKISVKSPSSNIVITQMMRRGHPGNVIRCKETGEVFASQNRAAEVLGLNAGNLSQHLQGKHDHVKGLTFEKLAEAV